MAGPSSHMWYVKAASAVWGPYPEARVAGFVAEGRVGPATLLSPWPVGPFARAQACVEFAPLFQAEPERVPEPLAGVPALSKAGPVAAIAAPAAASSQATADPAPAVAAVGPTRPLLVWAQLSAEGATAFHAALAGFGPALAIRPGLWLVQARTGAAALRNLLSRRLGEHDALLVVEAPLEHAAWFNLDPARDRELRQLWSAAQAGGADAFRR